MNRCVEDCAEIRAIAVLERRQNDLENEIEKALFHCAADDPMVLDLKRRILHLRNELEKFRY